jgi:hypothetical protein
MKNDDCEDLDVLVAVQCLNGQISKRIHHIPLLSANTKDKNSQGEGGDG